MNRQTAERAAPPIARDTQFLGLAEAIYKLLGELGPIVTREIRHHLLPAGRGDIPQTTIKKTIAAFLRDSVARRGYQGGFKEDSRFI